MITSKPSRIGLVGISKGNSAGGAKTYRFIHVRHIRGGGTNQVHAFSGGIQQSKFKFLHRIFEELIIHAPLINNAEFKVEILAPTGRDFHVLSFTNNNLGAECWGHIWRAIRLGTGGDQLLSHRRNCCKVSIFANR